MSVKVVPTPLITTPPTIASFDYSVQSFILNEKITFYVVLRDEKYIPITTSIITIDGNDYHAWGNDDSYVENFLCNVLKLTPIRNNTASVPETVPETVQETVQETVPETVQETVQETTMNE